MKLTSPNRHNELARESKRQRRTKRHAHKLISRDCEYLGFRPYRLPLQAVNKVTK